MSCNFIVWTFFGIHSCPNREAAICCASAVAFTSSGFFPVSVSCLPQAESKEAEAEADLAEAEAIKWRLMQSESTRFKACLSPAQSYSPTFLLNHSE